jgi:hypothetical protein
VLYVSLGVHKCSNSCSLSYYRVPTYNIFAITVIIIEKVMTESLMFIARQYSVMHMVKNGSEYAENTRNEHKKAIILELFKLCFVDQRFLPVHSMWKD